MRPKQRSQFSQKFGNLLKIEEAVLASNSCVPDFFQLWDLVFIGLVFSENFTKIAVKCNQTAEKTNLLDICGSYGCRH